MLLTMAKFLNLLDRDYDYALFPGSRQKNKVNVLWDQL